MAALAPRAGAFAAEPMGKDHFFEPAVQTGKRQHPNARGAREACAPAVGAHPGIESLR